MGREEYRFATVHLVSTLSTWRSRNLYFVVKMLRGQRVPSRSNY